MVMGARGQFPPGPPPALASPLVTCVAESGSPDAEADSGVQSSQLQQHGNAPSCRGPVCNPEIGVESAASPPPFPKLPVTKRELLQASHGTAGLPLLAGANT